MLTAEYAARLLPAAPRCGLRNALELPAPGVSVALDGVDDALAHRLVLLARATALLTVLVADGDDVHDWTFASDGFNAMGVRRLDADLELGQPTTNDELVATLSGDLGPGDGGSVLATNALLAALRRAAGSRDDCAGGPSDRTSPGAAPPDGPVPDALFASRLLTRRPDGSAVLTPEASRILPPAIASSWLAVLRRDLDPPCRTEEPPAELLFVGPPGRRITALNTDEPDLLLLADEPLELKSARVHAMCAPWVYEVPCQLEHGHGDRVLHTLRAGLHDAGSAPPPITREVTLPELLDARDSDATVALLWDAPVMFRLASRDWEGRIITRCAGVADITKAVLYRSTRIDGGELVQTTGAGFENLLAGELDLPLHDAAGETDEFVVAMSDLAAATPKDACEVDGLPASVAAAMRNGWRWCSAEVTWRPEPTVRTTERLTWLAASGHVWMLTVADPRSVRGQRVSGRSIVERLLSA